MPERAVSILIALILLLAATSAPAATQESVALIIGNSRYLHATPLRNPVNDARALAETLRKLDFEVIHGENLTRTDLEEQIAAFGKLIQDAKISVFFYAGHGLQVNGKNHLIPVDFDIEAEIELAAQLVSLDLLLGTMTSEERVNLIFLDACRDNPFAEQLKADMSGGRSLSLDGERTLKVVGQGLAEVEGGVGTLIAFATQPGNVALDGSGDHSPFTAAILENIGKPGLEVSNMLKNVRKQVYRETGGSQIPWDHSSLVERYYFKKKKQKAAPPP